MTDLRKLIAAAINNYRISTVSFQQTDMGLSFAIIAAFKKRGLVVVPDQITREMGDEICHDYDLADLQCDWIACLAASPYAKEFE